MQTTKERLGYVYVLMRPDLNACYVGQSVYTGRPQKHLKPGSYQYDILCADGVQPVIERPEASIPRGAELDEAERDWMRAMVEEGWTLINALGPDYEFPKMPFELLSKGGKKGGVIGGAKTQERRRTDPEFAAYWREVAAVAGGNAWAKKRREDPEFDARMREAELAAGVRGVATRRRKRDTDSEWAAEEKARMSRAGKIGGPAAGKKTSSMRRICAEYGHGPTTPGGLGFHHKSRGHAGFVDVTPPADHGTRED